MKSQDFMTRNATLPEMFLFHLKICLKSFVAHIADFLDLALSLCHSQEVRFGNSKVVVFWIIGIKAPVWQQFHNVEGLGGDLN